MSNYSIGSIKDYTPNFNFIIPKFDTATWHDYIESNFRSIDALFYNLFGINNYSGEWTKLTQYTTGQVLYIGKDIKDEEETEYSGRLVKVLQDHTTDNSEYFNLYYEQHPNYYELFADASTAQLFAQQAQQSAANAKTSETNSKESETNSANNAQVCTQKASEASNYANNAQQIVEDFENNVNSYTDSFNSNAESKLNVYNSNDTTKTDTFNQNYEEKLAIFNTNATEKTDIVNTKTQEAETSANNAKVSETNAKTSETLAKQYADSAKLSSFGNIGDIQYTARNQVPNGGAWCDGSEYTKAAFPQIYQMLLDNKLAQVDYATYSDRITTFGFCGFFGIDKDNEKFKVPTLKDMFIKAGTTAITAVKESLPNHIHTSLVAKDRNGFPNGWNDTATDKSWYWRYGDAQYNTSGVSNNSTYKNGAKVNPDHVVYRAYVVLYSTAVSASVAQAAEFIQSVSNLTQQMNSKININADNISATGYANIFKNILPDYGAAISVNTGSNYTAPNYGWFRFNSTKDSEQNITIKDVTYNNVIYSGGAARSYSPTITDFIFVEKGHVYQFTKDWGTFGKLYFYPIRGV